MKTKAHATNTMALTICAAAGLALVGCAAAPQKDAKWGYTGDRGAERWGQLDPAFADCDDGREQSPIDIPAGTHAHSPDIVFNYRASALRIGNNGHAIKANYDAGSSISVEGKTYTLLQFHLHALSEHTFAGEHSDMEIHFVHQSADGEYAVVGVMLDRGAENAAYEPVRAHAPKKPGRAKTIHGVTINAIDMLPTDRSYYRYDGSFTTPPCTEGVKWFVMATPVELSGAQISAFEAIYSGNYRPVQPMNGRAFH